MKYSDIFRAHLGKVSDKWSSYLPFYDALTDNFEPKTILEIGVQNGGSLEVWSKKYPNADLILGIDIDPKCVELTFEHPSIKVLVMDASKESTALAVAKLCSGFDLIVDDGSHRSGDIISALKFAIALLRPGGKYVIEDLHASYWPSWQGGLLESESSISYLKKITDLVNFEHWGLENVSEEYLCDYFGASEELLQKFRHVSSVEFQNSLCTLTMGASETTLGNRVVRGQAASVFTQIIEMDGTLSAPERYSPNPATLAVARPGGLAEIIAERDAVIAERDAVIAERDNIIASRTWRWSKLVRGFCQFEPLRKLL